LDIASVNVLISTVLILSLMSASGMLQPTDGRMKPIKQRLCDWLTGQAAA
jgi:hypothetical protein